MFCQKCGNQLNEGASFCPKCGAKIDSSSEPRLQGTNENNVNPVKTKKGKRVVIIAVIVVIMLLLIKSCVDHNGDETYAIRKALPVTWVAFFGDYECRLHFSEDLDEKGRMLGAAMLISRDKGGIYFEIIYLGEVEFLQPTETSGTIMLYNISNFDDLEHAYELDYIPIQYTYDPKTKELSLSSSFLTGILTNEVELEFTTQRDSHDYYKNIGERVYTWEAIFD